MRPAHLLTVIEKEFISTQSGHHTPVMLCSIAPFIFLVDVSD